MRAWASRADRALGEQVEHSGAEYDKIGVGPGARLVAGEATLAQKRGAAPGSAPRARGGQNAHCTMPACPAAPPALPLHGTARQTYTRRHRVEASPKMAAAMRKVKVEIISDTVW
jgi:hypothetical protein